MIIAILCSSTSHPIMPILAEAAEVWRREHTVTIHHQKQDLPGGDLLFLVSCTEIITEHDRAKYGAALVLHASPLPIGRGWSPHIWALIEGAEEITLSLIEASDKVDTGNIWLQRRIPIARHLIWSEINEALFSAEVELMDTVICNSEEIRPRPQSAEIYPTYYRKRTPSDSEIDAHKSISEQFNIIRVSDPERYPAYFDLFGCRYSIKLEKVDVQNNRD